jgi:hypothetical protein
MNRELQHLSPRARAAVNRAEQAARALNHCYLGTEHVLLGIIGETSDAAAVTLRKLGVDADAVRADIERLVQRGPEPTGPAPLPLTPRANEAIRLAADEAQSVAQAEVDSEHLLLGLAREPDGVAAVVLRNLGLPLEELRQALLRTRFQQMQLVERAVRPVRAGTPRKRKMREELLAHLTAIYHEALERESDPDDALSAAAERFGHPAALAREFDAALPRYERRNYYSERLFGWRAPETAAKWVARLSWYLFLFLALLFAIGLTAAAAVGGGFHVFEWRDLRGAIAYVALFPAGMAAAGLLYFKIRDALFGLFNSRKSWATVLQMQLLMVAAITACGVAFVAFTEWSLDRAAQFLLPYAIAGTAAAIAALVAARIKGPTEYRDALWELLDLTDAAVAE